MGDGILRSTGTDVQPYKAVTIQGNGAELSPISLGSGSALVFDGADGHYQAVAGQITTDVAFDSHVEKA